MNLLEKVSRTHGEQSEEEGFELGQAGRLPPQENLDVYLFGIPLVI
jgi:hypothetical protein